MTRFAQVYYITEVQLLMMFGPPSIPTSFRPHSLLAFHLFSREILGVGTPYPESGNQREEHAPDVGTREMLVPLIRSGGGLMAAGRCVALFFMPARSDSGRYRDHICNLNLETPSEWVEAIWFFCENLEMRAVSLREARRGAGEAERSKASQHAHAM